MDTADTSLRSVDISRFLPEPKCVPQVLKLQYSDPALFECWKKSFCKEMRNLIKDHSTFVLGERKEREKIIPVTVPLKAKINSDGTLDKGKTRICVCGDIERNQFSEDTWSPLSSFELLKVLWLVPLDRKHQ